MSSRRATTTPSRLKGVLVWMLAGLVLALGLLSVSPKAHAHLHGHDSDAQHTHAPLAAGHDDDGCAITLFQHGVTTPLDLPSIATPRTPCIATLTPALVTDAPSAPRHLLRPARGPPCIG
jgi:hypothetical protein